MGVIQAVLMGTLARPTPSVNLIARKNNVANRIKPNRNGSLVRIRQVEVH